MASGVKVKGEQLWARSPPSIVSHFSLSFNFYKHISTFPARREVERTDDEVHTNVHSCPEVNRKQTGNKLMRS